jgi:hypothetical protein
LEKIQHRARTRLLVLMVVLSALAFGTIGVAAVSAPDPSVQAEGRDPTSPVSSSAQPTMVPITTLPASLTEATPAASTLEALPAAPAPEVVQPSRQSRPYRLLLFPRRCRWATCLAGGRSLQKTLPTEMSPSAVSPARPTAHAGARITSDGTPDTAAQQVPKGERKSGYYPSKVLSVHDGVLDMFLHSENGVAMGAAPSPIFGGAVQRPWNSLTYGRYSVRFKADALGGFKLAWLLWPDSKQWPQDGEIDFPEGDLSRVIYAALHYVGDGHPLRRLSSQRSFGAWHTATTEWSPDASSFSLMGILSVFRPKAYPSSQCTTSCRPNPAPRPVRCPKPAAMLRLTG